MKAKELFAAIQNGDSQKVTSLLSDDPQLVAARNDQGIAPLFFACYLRQPEIAGCIADLKGELDVFEAAALGNAGRLQELLAEDSSSALAWSVDGFQPLHFAAFFGHEEAVRCLLGFGLPPDEEARNPMKVHPLHSAAAAGSLAIVEALLEAGADPNAVQQMGYTALMTAALHGKVPLVDVLLRHGAHPGTLAEDGKTAASLARQGGHDALAERLA